jgi:hypothetical protein
MKAQYFYSESSDKFFALKMENNEIRLYWVSVKGDKSRSFLHARGADTFPSLEMALKFLNLVAVPSNESVYIEAIKDYFAADKKLRELFIKQQLKV